MIHALDHIVVAAASLEAAVADYEVLLGRRADRPAHSGGAGPASIQLANVRLDLVADVAGAADGLSALGFAVADLAKAQALFERRALRPERADGDPVLRIATEATHGVPVGLVEHAPGAAAEPASSATGEPDAEVAGLDHVVIRSPNPERAVALYAGRLDLSLRLDRSEPAWGARLLFFRCGDLIVEVAHDLKAGISDGPDRLWGLSWRVPDIAKAHARLRAAGVTVSDLCAGRRPHTRVFTAKSHTAGVPTLVIGADPRQIVLPSHPLGQI
jgi:catechol 2,3-dioxygenase-like lactoylglutathione lyase family enzyme